MTPQMSNRIFPEPEDRMHPSFSSRPLSARQVRRFHRSSKDRCGPEK